MDSERPGRPGHKRSRRRRLPLGRSGRRTSFERRLQLWLHLLGLPVVVLCWLLMQQRAVDTSVQWIVVALVAGGWALAVSAVMSQIVRPLQTLANVVAALREDDFSFRARGGRRNDAFGDLALEINRLANTLQAQRVGALEAMELAERVMLSMQSPVLAFDLEGHLKLANSASESALGIGGKEALGSSAEQLSLGKLLEVADGDVLPLGSGQQAARWVVRRTSFRLRGVPHTLFVLSDVSAALREEEKLAWERLIRVLGHEINNSLTPIKSIAGSLRGRLAVLGRSEDERSDFDRGLEVIENRSESLNRFLQAYRQLMRLPSPKLRLVSLVELLDRVAQLERRVAVTVRRAEDLILELDADQMEQALINLVRNAADASLGPDAAADRGAQVEISWDKVDAEVVIAVEDNGPGLSNAGNLFVPFYTTKPGGTGIGLVLAQQIAQAHRGTVQLANRADGHVGCRAEIRLPV